MLMVKAIAITQEIPLEIFKKTMIMEVKSYQELLKERDYLISGIK